MKFSILIPALLLVPIAFGLPGSAQAEEINQELYDLCSRFPYNSRCEGFEAPISLDRRSGDEGVCELTTGETTLSGKCKIVLTDTMMTAYIETGDRLELLDNERATQEVAIPMGAIAGLTYREETNSRNRLANTLAFGVLGALLTRSRTVSQIGVNFTTNAESAPVSNLLLEVDRELGTSTRGRLEQLTGLQSIFPPDN